MMIYSDFFKKLNGIISEPSKAFETSKEEKFVSVVKYYFSLIGFAVIFSIIIAMWLLIKYAAIEFFAYSLIKNIIIILFWFFFWIILIFIFSAIVHIIFYLSGTKNKFTFTLKAFVYSLTPILLFGWMSYYFFVTIIINEPQLLFNWKSVISIIAWTWSTVLLIIGLQHLIGITKGKALISGILIMAILLSINYYLIYIIKTAEPSILIPLIIGG